MGRALRARLLDSVLRMPRAERAAHPPARLLERGQPIAGFTSFCGLLACEPCPAPPPAPLTRPLRRFGERLGPVLFRVPENVRRDDARLAGLLTAWPRELPLALEFQDASWHVDDVFRAVADAGGVLVATDLEADREPPPLRRSGPFLYLRLRRPDYSADELARWVDRLEPFLADGLDAYVYFRHDDVGRGAELALELAARAAAAGVGVASSPQ